MQGCKTGEQQDILQFIHLSLYQCPEDASLTANWNFRHLKRG